MDLARTLQLNYVNYDRQKCFVAHSLGADWSGDLKSACATILPKFNLEPWYAADHFDPTQPLRDKVVELIANSRYGIYDISNWQDKQGNWYLPRNVFIELGIAIAFNRPTLLLRHSSNQHLPLPACLQSVEIVEFAGDITLKKELEKRLPHWLDIPPDRDWLNRFCIFGNRICSFREQHPCSQQWGRQTIPCHISDGLDVKHTNFSQFECDEVRGAFEEIFSRFSDLEFCYLDELTVADGYQFLTCSHCQTIRSTPFAIYRITPTTSAETFVAIGISIALEKLFEYKIPKMILVKQEQDLPSLLRGYEVIEAVGTKGTKSKLKVFVPNVIKTIREKSWRPRPLPFIEIKIPCVGNLDLLESDSEQEQKSKISDNIPAEYLSLPIEELRLPIRVYNVIKRNSVNSVGDLLKFTPKELSKIRNLGINSKDEIVSSLKALLKVVWSDSLWQYLPQEYSEEEPTDNIPIEELQLSVRAYNCLKRAQVNSVADLLDFSLEDLLEIKNFGQKSAEEVIEALQERLGITLPLEKKSFNTVPTSPTSDLSDFE